MTELEREIMQMPPEERKKAVEAISSQMGYMGPYIPEIHDRHRKEKIQKD